MSHGQTNHWRLGKPLYNVGLEGGRFKGTTLTGLDNEL